MGSGRAMESGQPSEEKGGEDYKTLADEPLWQVANRVAASKGFAKSKFLTNFILYICEMHLNGRSAELTEQRIGERVFERPAGYSPGDDNIVRNYARILRQRLNDYFESEGQQEPIRIVVPRGRYVPLCVEVDKTVGAVWIEAAPEPISPAIQIEVHSPDLSLEPLPAHQAEAAGQNGSKRWLVPSLWIVLALCTTSTLVLAMLLLRARPAKPPARASHQFWSAIFNPTRDTLIIPADTGLVIYQDMTKQQIHLAEYATGEYQTVSVAPKGLTLDWINELGGRRYTSFVDLQLVANLVLLPEVVKERLQIRYAREVNLDELKKSNAILLGSADSTPWAELFQRELNFQFVHESPSSTNVSIHNLHPGAGEKDVYQTDRSDPAHSTLGLLAVLPSLDGKGRVLLIEGIDMAGTEAAADYLFSEDMTSL